MTDDRDRPMTQHLPPPSPDDPSAGQSSRTDAPALRDADALDAWLDARASSSHAGAAATPATDRAGQNGQSLWLSSRSTTTTDAASLTGAASRFHARVAAAEEAEAPPAPVDAIWEQIMATSVLTPIPGVAAPTAHAHSPARAERPERHPFLRTAGSHPAATAVLVAAVILATILVFRAFDRNTPPPIVDQGPAALIPDGSATPTASPAAAACTYSLMTDAEAAALIAQATPQTASDYLPVTTPVSAADAQAALEARRGFAWCDRSQEVRNAPFYLQRASLETDARVAQIVMQATPASLVQQAEESLALTKALSPVLATPNPAAYIVDPTDPAVTPYLIPDALGQGAPVNALLPQDFVTLPDGRIGAPLKTARVGGAGTTGANDYLSSQGVNFVVFAQVNGQWLVDTSVWLCTANCDAYYAEREDYIASLRTWADQAASPQASPPPAVASPPAIDPSANLPIPASECVVPTIAVGNEALPERQYAPPLKPTDANATAVTSDARAFIACAEATPSTDNVQDVIAPFETERLRNEMDANPDQPQTTEQIEAGKRISAYLEEQGVTSFAERAPADVTDPGVSDWPGTIGANGQIADNSPGSYMVPMPGMSMQFPDGRIGVPTLAMVTNDNLWTFLQDQPYTSGSLWIFTKVGGTWLLDEGIPLCIGECDTFWQDAATPSGDSQWLQPVNASECQPVSASTYREYVRPRDYTIVNVPASDGGGVARQGRTWAACSSNGFLGNSTIDRQFETQRFADAGGTTQPLTDEQITRAMELSEHYQDAGYQVFQRAPEGMNLTGNPAAKQASFSDQEFTYTYVFEPDEAIGLSDGRVAIPVTILFADDGTSTTVENQPTQATLLAVWAYIGETWLLDETLPICLGDCAGFWANPPATDFPTSSPLMNIWFQVFTVNPNAPVSTPVASASPADDDLAFWLSMPGVDECVLPDGGPFTSNRTREYLPWTAPADTTARQVAQADRNRVACDQRSGLVPGSTLYTSRYIGPAVPGSAVDAETLTRMQALSAAIPEQDPAAWVRQGRTGAAGLTGDAAQRYAVLPENVYRLPDGRYAAIPVTIATDAATVLANGAVTLPVAIYAQSGDAWLLDEQVAVCLGDCRAYWNGFHVIDAPTGTPGTPATPAGLAIVPIDRRTLAVA